MCDCRGYYYCEDSCYTACEDVCVDDDATAKGPSGSSGNVTQVGASTTLCQPCAGNKECGSNALCLVFDASQSEGFCGRTCAANSDCPGGFTCRSAGTSRQCVPVDGKCDGLTVVDQCSTDAACGNGRICHNGGCIAAPPVACAVSSQCAGDGLCVNGFCRTSCKTNSECTTQEVCDLGVCSPSPSVQCTSSSQCGDGYACEDGRCRAGCRQNFDCLVGETCSATGVCNRYGQTTCTGNAQCLAEERCEGGACTLVCVDASQCPVGWACDDRSKLCERNLGDAYCVTDVECPYTARCDGSNHCVTVSSGGPSGSTGSSGL